MTRRAVLTHAIALALIPALLHAQSATPLTNANPATASQPAAYIGTPGDYVARDFRFGTGETLPELKLHYLTLGTPHRDAAGHVDNAVLLLHGTGGNAHSLFNRVFADVLFGPGQPLDIARYYLIFPDDIGHGESSKPSDGLHMRFPQYDYDDMVRSQHQMLLEGLHVDHLRLILGTSMGCMQSFVWGETYPSFTDALMPLACQPVALAGRNREWRYMAIQAIRKDPAWRNGEYTSEPTQGLTFANDLLLLAGGAPLQLQKNYPTRSAVEGYVDQSVARSNATTDANNMLYYINASRNYDPSANLAKITVPVMYINSADDFLNPPELGLAEKLTSQMPRAKFVLLPITDATRGHGTHTQAAIWKDYLIQLLYESRRTPSFTGSLSLSSEKVRVGQSIQAVFTERSLVDVETSFEDWTVRVEGASGEPPTTLRQRRWTYRELPGEPVLWSAASIRCCPPEARRPSERNSRSCTTCIGREGTQFPHKRRAFTPTRSPLRWSLKGESLAG